ncbi:unnamed protein product [Nesidiocoris tenuis]|uniref:Uncharacterized protein n=1 Tax=Nesidiocoris tenuis TaxID=355587 RepID=A0A6H5HQX0_9HEMI|nr:unnamed protein product [Nesidiocoris tenuis]
MRMIKMLKLTLFSHCTQREGKVSSRNLILRRLDDDGFVLMTDNRSKKAREMVKQIWHDTSRFGWKELSKSCRTITGRNSTKRNLFSAKFGLTYVTRVPQSSGMLSRNITTNYFKGGKKELSSSTNQTMWSALLCIHEKLRLNLRQKHWKKKKKTYLEAQFGQK